MQVLALDTSTSCLSVALVRDGETVCEINQQTKAGHAGMVLPVIDEVLARASTDKNRIDLIAVGTGPGSFTGIRIGIATARGLSDALSCPLLGVSTLDTLAQGALPSPIPVLPVLDARKGEVFCARYDEHGSRFTDAAHLKPERVVDMVKDETLFTGSGCALYREVFIRGLGRLYHEAATHLWNPRASVLAGIALTVPPEAYPKDVLPVYVRESDAMILLEKTMRT
ncbi:MAG TPA: tRNA (adenosine(37)-N6)-threonylcarbamoyltransferase complex dimerization subunit type 1 TsaB [Deltaproteobacteria bacterium]|nr:tRNA (adenosine(37)-N6)-threonylcarbamoyltransferase complex dimerization subunit type 1 TsaB [Deltaproteobacteria bacterium]HQI82877.1 tRNA (adenosine(37)-N6)-threonylcarbamoyltransferase complex dimerization subunit type 1 TsaB [Deltaproteobacteria bacterium]